MKKGLQKIIRNSRGQVAIFVALIFQVLFVFFAMIVNVGLLVHHKINLQNSVDLAAYYGAMKQAEMLNAMAHVNYQIRQSYKLLAFRYQQLGGAGTAGSDTQKPPFTTKQGGNIVSEDDKPIGYDTAFCMPYNPVDLVADNTNPESYCKEPQGIDVPVPGIPAFGPDLSWVSFQTGIIQVATQLRNAAYSFCRRSMTFNWLQLAQFIGAYKYDIRNRKKLILGLANELSKEDPRDIEGASIREGAYKTLLRNLTYPNKDGLKERFGDNGSGSGSQEFDFKFVNSFALGSCRGNPTDSSPPAWLKEIYIYPMYAAVDAKCGTGSDANIHFTDKAFFNDGTASISQNIPPDLQNQAKQLALLASEYPSNNPQQLLSRASMGFEKDPWCVGYVGVSATTTPKIPFSPFGSVTMKATAFAKPFGGRIGPWYGTTWDASSGGDTKSNPSKLTDPMLPVRVEASPVNPPTKNEIEELKKQKRLFPNHSRYLGDTVGIVSELTVGQFFKSIHQKMGRIRLGWYNPPGWYSHIVDPKENFDDKSSNGDILAWDNEMNKTTPLRDLEIAAIAPDQFDTATYSIDPDFYNNYVTKIEKGYGSQFQFLIRGDLGSRMQGSEEQKRFSIRSQIESLTNNTNQLIDWQNKLTYYLNTFGQVLTSWQQKSPDEYVIDDSRFGICQTDAGGQSNSSDRIGQKASDSKFFTAGSCKRGGRTGYSVKLVDGKFLKNEVNGNPQQYNLGGKDKFGSIKNPPPDL